MHHCRQGRDAGPPAFLWPRTPLVETSPGGGADRPAPTSLGAFQKLLCPVRRFLLGCVLTPLPLGGCVGVGGCGFYKVGPPPKTPKKPPRGGEGATKPREL